MWVGDFLQGVREVFLCVGGGLPSRCEGGVLVCGWGTSFKV